MRRAVSAFEAVKVGHGDLEDALVEEEDAAEGLVLGGGGDVALHGEIVEERRDLGRAELPRVAAAVERDEGTDPVDVRFLGAGGVVQAAEGGVDGLGQGHEEVSTRGGRKLRGQGEKS